MNIVLQSILMDAFFICLLVWCGYTDIRQRIVPNIAIIILLYLGIAHIGLMVFTQNIWWTYPLGLVFAVPFFIALMKNNISAGDVKLVMAIALYLGFLNTIIAFVLMVPVIVVLIIKSWIKKKTLKYQIPFAPVLAFGAIGAVIAGYLYKLI